MTAPAKPKPPAQQIVTNAILATIDQAAADIVARALARKGGA